MSVRRVFVDLSQTIVRVLAALNQLSLPVLLLTKKHELAPGYRAFFDLKILLQQGKDNLRLAQPLFIGLAFVVNHRSQRLDLLRQTSSDGVSAYGMGE